MRILRSLRVLAFLATLLGGNVCIAATASARAIEARLYAPCCYSQTLDVHESDIAYSLRAEIENRVARGETAESIDSDLVARYGSRIHAIPAWGPLFIPGTALGGIVIGTLLVGRTMRRWRTVPNSDRHPQAALQYHPGGPAPDEQDARLDDELRAMDP